MDLLPANWADGDDFTAGTENTVEAAVNAMMSVTGTSASSVTLSVDTSAYVFTGSTAAWTLPAVADGANKLFTFYNRGSASVTINCASGEHIYPTDTSLTLPTGASAVLLCDGTYWLRVSQ